MIKSSKMENRSAPRRTTTIAKPVVPPRSPSPIARAAPAAPVAKTGSSLPPMMAARLYGPRDIQVERVPHPGNPGPGNVLLRVTATGICGSDLHTFADARIGDTVLKPPLVLGHEFAGVIESIG